MIHDDYATATRNPARRFTFASTTPRAIFESRLRSPARVPPFPRVPIESPWRVATARSATTLASPGSQEGGGGSRSERESARCGAKVLVLVLVLVVGMEMEEGCEHEREEWKDARKKFG